MNPVALITGASRGIGRGVAVELAKTGHDLVINFACDTDAAKAAAADCRSAGAAKGLAVRVETCRADVSRALDRAALVRFTRSTFGRLDLLVNNAGVAPTLRADILDADERSLDHLLAVNLKGPYFLTQLVAEGMIEQVEKQRLAGLSSSNRTIDQRRSRTWHSLPKIVNISSISAYTASVNRGDYCIAKAGLSMVTKLFAARLAEFGINVYEIRPGIIATDMTAPVKKKYDRAINRGLTPISRWGTPEDIGRAVAAIAQDLLPFSTGEVINVDGGFHLRRL